MSDLTNIEKLEKILINPRLRVSSRSFVESIKAQAEKKELSEKQVVWVDKFWAECFPPQEVLEQEKLWESSMDDERKRNVNIMGRYYAAHYNSSILAKNYTNPEWVCPQNIYEKSVESAWAQKIISNFNEQPEHSCGDLVYARDTTQNRSKNWFEKETAYLVLNVSSLPEKDFVLHYELINPNLMEDQKTFEIRSSALLPKKSKKYNR